MTSELMRQQQSRVIPRYARIDVIGGALIVFLSGLIWFGAVDLDIRTLTDFGPGAMPKGLAVLLLATGAVVLLRGLVQPDESAERFDLAVRPAAILMIAILLFGLFIRGTSLGIVSTPQLGMLIVGPLTVFVAGCATPQVDVKALVTLSFGLTAAMLLVFVDLLGVTLPIFPKAIQDAIALSFDADIAVRTAYIAYGVIAAILYIAFYGITEKRRG